MKAVILAAGQGRRLLPRTQDLPKCLLPLAGRSLLSWQLAALAANSVEEAVVVTGFAAAEIEREIARAAPAGLAVTTLFNPFYGVADNIVSCWMAREHLGGDVAVINGDTLFEPQVLARARDGARHPVNVTIDIKDGYDADDMKVQLAGDRVVHVGKTLPPEHSHAESIGMVLMHGPGAPLFVNMVEAVMRRPGGVGRWYLSAVDELAAQKVVGAVSIAGLDWTEVDYPEDLSRADQMARRWVERGAPRLNRMPGAPG